MAYYNFNVEFVTSKGKKVCIDTSAKYGYFEMSDGSEGGGLWFETVDDKLMLIDYDGQPSLGKSIIDGLREHGFIVESDFE